MLSNIWIFVPKTRRANLQQQVFLALLDRKFVIYGPQTQSFAPFYHNDSVQFFVQLANHKFLVSSSGKFSMASLGPFIKI